MIRVKILDDESLEIRFEAKSALLVANFANEMKSLATALADQPEHEWACLILPKKVMQ